MEGIIVACITGVLSLLGVIFTNMFSNRAIENKLTTAQAVTDTKIDMLTEEVKKHNNFAARMPVVEQQISEINRRVDNLERSFKKGDDGK
jgi:peptidoglycan hydrolase CwlO-like protein